jgi:hypothetical protein
MISEAQHGFVKGCCTVFSLIQFSNFVILEMEEGWQVDAEYNNFSNAFDMVNRGSLLCWMA